MDYYLLQQVNGMTLAVTVRSILSFMTDFHAKYVKSWFCQVRHAGSSFQFQINAAVISHTWSFCVRDSVFSHITAVDKKLSTSYQQQHIKTDAKA